MNAAQILPGLKSVSYSGSFLCDFVENFPESCVVREACSEKYLLVNRHMVNLCGLQSINDVVGMTRHDLWIQDTAHRRKDLNLDALIIANEEKNVELDVKLEKQVLLNNQPVSNHHVIIDNNGLIEFRNVIKIPIPNHKNKTVAFLSMSMNKTCRLSLYKLFQSYQDFYPKKQSIQKMLQHLELDDCFNPLALPTGAEMRVLLAMRSDSRCKAVAKQLGCSVATANNHISNLQEKSRPHNLHDILLRLRAIPVGGQDINVSSLK